MATGRWRRLTGDELGALLADHLLSATDGDDRLVATTIVSSTMLSKMAASGRCGLCRDTDRLQMDREGGLGASGSRLVFGYEEALGYEVADAVADKDGLSAALVAAEIAATAKAGGRSVCELLDDLASRFGVHATSQWSLRLSGHGAQDEMAGIVSPPAERPARRPRRSSVNQSSISRVAPTSCRRPTPSSCASSGGLPSFSARAAPTEAEGLFRGGHRTGFARRTRANDAAGR